MIRRWLIRCLCLLPLLLCATGWCRNLCVVDVLRLRRADLFLRGALYLASANGALTLYQPVSPLFTSASSPTWEPPVHDWSRDRPGHWAWPRPIWLNPWRPTYHQEADTWHLAIPFYLPTALSALLVLLAWRTTRPRHGGGQGFPVELGGRGRR